MARLGGECLVRPVSADTDVGIDLYCETVVESQPFLHFWLQVKAGNQCAVSSSNTASCRFTKEELLYWRRQPVPVFAALVPTEWPVVAEPDVYIVDITTHILFSEGTGTQQSFALQADYHWPAGEQEPVRAFLADVVPITTARLHIANGVVASKPTPAPRYERQTPFVPVIRFEKQIRDQLRTTAANSILFALSGEGSAQANPQFHRLLARIVEQFDDDLHWETFMARALSYHADEQYDKALAMYEMAKASIQNDAQVRDQPPWQESVATINRMEHRARKGKPPG